MEYFIMTEVSLHGPKGFESVAKVVVPAKGDEPPCETSRVQGAVNPFAASETVVPRGTPVSALATFFNREP
jgi:hypothetical protein